MPIIKKQNICGRCGKCARIDEAEYCSHCLVEVIEKRVSKRLNTISCGNGKPGSSRMLIVCESKSSLSCAVAAYLAKKLCRIAAVSVIKKAKASHRSMMRQPHRAVIIPRCADETATDFLARLIGGVSINGSRNTTAPDAANAVNIFELVTEKELELYATIKKIKWVKEKESSLKRRIQSLQAKYPGTIEALAQASRQIG